MNFGFNWSYIDSKHIAYAAVGLDAAAGHGHLARLPDPRHRQVRLEGLQPERPRRPTGCRSAKHPHAVDPPYLVSWNNKQAPGWAAADDKWAYGPLHRSQMIADKVARGDQGRAAR